MWKHLRTCVWHATPLTKESRLLPQCGMGTWVVDMIIIWSQSVG